MDTSFTDTITTDDAFEATLEDLLAAAETNEVRIEGGWECKGHDGGIWDVVITQVVPEADD